jgi:cell division protein FtsI (penicillin-binding protein 3)
VCADPSKIGNPSYVAEKIVHVLHIDKNEALKNLSKSGSFCWLARKIPPDQAKIIKAMNLEGVFLIKESKRFYPNADMAGHLIGFAGLDSTGLGGLELKYEQYVKGAEQKLSYSRDAKGKMLYRIEKTNLASGEDYKHLVLTIDSRIQYMVESQLRQAVEAKGAKGGLAIVMDPRTGEILAMAIEPSFDPNNFCKYSPDRIRIKTITDCFDPGSTFKPFLVAAALQEGVVKETDKFFCENGNYKIANRVIHEAQRKKHGTLSVHDVIKYSSNIGAVKIAEKLGKEKFYCYIQKFGFGSRTDIDLPGEASGLLRPVKDWARVDSATIAFGQGISVTAIQLITALSAIANHGVMMKPFVVRALVNQEGNIVESFKPTVIRQVVSPETAKRLTAMLTDVVEQDDGTGKNARITDVLVAGKTGTSQKFDPIHGVYSSARVRTSFMGFFPANNPQMCILVSLDEPQTDRWGGLAAAPIFKNIGEQILTCFKTDLRKTPKTAAVAVKANDPMKVDLVSAHDFIPQSTVMADALDEQMMPDFRGMTIRDALKKAKHRMIDLKAIGSGWAVAQDPPAGAPIKNNKLCTVTFSDGY